MKTKLLKKIRKRYYWYYNQDGHLILVDKKRKDLTMYTLNYLMKRFRMTAEEVAREVAIPIEDWKFRIMKKDILAKFGIPIDWLWVNRAIRFESRWKTKGAIINKGEKNGKYSDNRD